MDKKELHRRIIKSFIEPSLFYIPYKKNNDGLRIYTKYYNVYTKKIEEFDLVSKTIHTPVIRDELGHLTHPNFKMDGYYVIYDENHKIVAESNDLYKILDTVYPKGKYIIHEKIIPKYGFKQMDDIILVLYTAGKLININQSIYRECLGYIYCDDPQLPEWRLPIGIDKFPIDTGIPQSDLGRHRDPIVIGGEAPYYTSKFRELKNGSIFKEITGLSISRTGPGDVSFYPSIRGSKNFMITPTDEYKFYCVSILNDPYGNPYSGWLQFSTHRHSMINNIPVYHGLKCFSVEESFNLREEGYSTVPAKSEFEEAVNKYMISNNPNDLQFWNGHNLDWRIGGDSHPAPYENYSNFYQAFLQEGQYDPQYYGISFRGGEEVYSLKIPYTLINTIYTPEYWENEDTAYIEHGYVSAKLRDASVKLETQIGSYIYLLYERK